MKWIGQHIWDYVSRFRNDVYLESISTGTIASGAHLGLDSNNKIVKAVDGGGDLTGITAGVGLSGDDLTGPVPTLTVDFSEFSTVTPAHGDFLATLDSDGANEQKTSLHALATLYSGTGLNANTSTINVDSAQPVIESVGQNSRDVVIGFGESGVNLTLGETTAVFDVATAARMTINATEWKPPHNTVSLGATDARFVNGYFEDVVVSTGFSGALTGNASSATVATNVTVVANNTEDATHYPVFVDAVSGSQGIETDTGLTWNPLNNILTAATFAGNVTGTAATVTTASQPNITTLAGVTSIGTDGNSLAILHDDVTISNSTTSKPVLTLKTTHTTSSNSSELQFLKDATNTEDSEDLGKITFYGEDAGNNNTQFAEIKSEIVDTTEAMEGGKLTLSVASHDAGMTQGMVIDGSSSFTDATCDYNNSTTITMDSTLYLDGLMGAGGSAGMSVSGTGIPAGAYVVQVVDATTFTLSAATTGGSVTNGTLTFGNSNDEVNVTLGNGSNSTVTLPGNLLAATGGTGSRQWGASVKILPGDFIQNEGGGANKSAQFVTDSWSSTGVRATSTDAELWAFVSIPNGMKATQTIVYGSEGSTVVNVYDYNLEDGTYSQPAAGTNANAGFGTIDSYIDHADIKSTGKNCIAVGVTIDDITGSGIETVYGGLILVAPI